MVQEKGAEIGRAPLCDVQSVLVHAGHATYSHGLLLRQSAHDIPLVVCDNRHEPVAILISLTGHHRHAGLNAFVAVLRGSGRGQQRHHNSKRGQKKFHANILPPIPPEKRNGDPNASYRTATSLSRNSSQYALHHSVESRSFRSHAVISLST